ncbi:MAG: YegS/Rv2252/BmrU family lipid kinase [Planctomycetes bacterium]|nr:YegS/Rv2252/BmrU family lipid kinase [Planctomycetota bacterium]
MNRPPFVIANPRAAGGRVGRWIEANRRRIEAALPGTELALTAGTGDATRLARRAIDSGVTTVVSIGGDGTASETLGGFFDGDRPVRPGVALAIVDGGTGGDFARLVRAPRLDAWRPEGIARARRRAIDVGHVAYTHRDGSPGARVFLNIASFGSGGEVVDRVNRSSKRFGGFLTFGAVSLSVSLTYRNRPVRILADGEEIARGPIFVGAVANGRWFGGGMRIAPRARLDDGAFDLVLLPHRRPVRRLAVGLAIYQGAHLRDRETFWRRASRVEAIPLDPEPVLLDVDGEQPGRLPATFRILPRAVDVVLLDETGARGPRKASD